MRKIVLFIFIYSLFLSLKSQTAGFTYTQSSACAPATFYFTSTTTGNISSYSWDFGDGFTSNIQNPTHPYTNSGTYTVQLTVHFQDGSVNSTTQNIQIFTPPAFTFTKLNDSVCPGGSVSFTSSVSSSIAIRSYDWDFGDGGKSSSANPVYQYSNPSNITTSYTVSLIVTDVNGCSSKVDKNNYIYVKQKPMPEFDADQRSFCYSASSPARVNFTNTTTVTSNNTYYWQFGDGQSSTDENPTHSYTGKANYSVSLHATSSEGCSNSISKPTYIQITEFNMQYTVSDTILCSVPGTLTAKGANYNTSYLWDFGNGAKIPSNATYSINNTYTSSGTYTVKVTGVYLGGSCSDSSSVVIHVYDSTKAAFTEYDSINHVCEPFYALGFKDYTPYTSNDDFGFGSIVWNFGDSTTASGDTVSHIFPDYGEYEVTLSVTTPYGCKLRDTAKIIVIRPWKVEGAIHPLTNGCIPYIMGGLTFGIYSSTFVDITVDWGDGAQDHQDSLIAPYPKYDPRSIPIKISVSFNPSSHTYTDTMPHVITFTATNEQGCTIYDTIEIVQGGMPPKVGARYTYVEDCFTEFKTRSKLLVVAFDSLDAGGNPVAGVYADYWTWISADHGGTISSGNNKDSTYLGVDRLGYFSVMVYGSNNGCPGDTIRLDSIAFVCPPIAGFEPFDISFCEFPADIQFRNNSHMATAYRWYFGDADLLSDQSTDTATAPSFEYTQSNTFIYDSAFNPGLRPRLVAYNDDSLDVNSPTYNKCGFCTDTVFGMIRIADPHLYFKCDTICEKTNFTFYDRSTSRPETVGWRFYIESHDSLIQENTGWHPLPRYWTSPYDSGYIAPNVGATLYFSQPNTYTAYFFNVDLMGCLHSDTVVFYVYPKSIPQFVSGKEYSDMALGKDTLCVNVPDWLYLKDSSYTAAPFDTAKIIAWRWIIDEDTSYAVEPVYKNLSTGLHNVNMQITNQYGCTSEATLIDHVLNREITARFAPSRPDRKYCNHTSVELVNMSYMIPPSAGTTLVCTWDFGDGTPLYTQTGISNVQHTYHLTQNLPDTMFITLTVTSDGSNCENTVTGYVIITGPIASFTDDGHEFPCPDFGRQIQFTNTSIGSPVSYYWNFGDSSSGNSNESYLKDPMHDYLHAGSYDITLIVTDNTGCTDTLHAPRHVFIDGPMGNFTYGELEGCAPHTVIFVPSISNADSIIVNPDRATAIARTGSHMNDTITFTYQTPKSYLPYFYLIKWTDDNGQMKRCVVEWGASDTIHVIDIIPDFEADSVYCSDDPVTFVNTSEVIPSNFALDSVIWNFGDGSTSHDMDSTTVHYQADGIYTVLLDLYAKRCHRQISKTIEILSFPDIVLDLESQSGCDSLEFSFYAEVDSTNQEKIHFLWTFWDGKELQTNPANRGFKTSGYYYYSLEITLDSNKCNKIFNDSVHIEIYTSPAANFEALPQPANYGDEISFTDLSTFIHGNIAKWNWDFGDNSGSDEQNPSHIYETSGKLMVSLFIEDEYGCKSDTSLEIIILESLIFGNVLTPAGTDGRKYVFRPLEEMGYYKEFKMHIYNRHGMLIWSNTCTEPDCPDYSDAFWWDGRNSQGKPVDDGVYYWVVSAVPLSETTIFFQNGSVTVFNSK